MIKSFWAIALVSLSLSPVAWAQLPPATSAVPTEQLLFNDPKPPSQGAPSGRRRGGASRGNCRQFEALTALVPANNGKVWGQTLSDRPTFWFYLPAPLVGNTPIEFVVQDTSDRYVYNTRIAAAKTGAGLMQLSLPTTAQPLEVGKSYIWTLSIYCDPAKPSQAVFVNGLIQRMAASPDLQRRLATAAPLGQVKLYAANGIWYEALDRLATLYRTNPQERQIAAAWTSLLQQAKLEPVSQAPFTRCCTAASAGLKKGDR